MIFHFPLYSFSDSDEAFFVRIGFVVDDRECVRILENRLRFFKFPLERYDTLAARQRKPQQASWARQSCHDRDLREAPYGE